MVAVDPNFCHQCGAALSERRIHGRDRKACPDCGYRHFHNAVPVVDVIVRDGTDVLLMDPRQGDRWMLPGGHPEVEEEPVDAAARELEEETGIEVNPTDLRLLSAIHSEHQDRHYNMITYVVDYEMTDGELAPGKEAIAVEFRPLDKIFMSSSDTRYVDRRVLKTEFDR